MRVLYFLDTEDAHFLPKEQFKRSKIRQFANFCFRFPKKY